MAPMPQPDFASSAQPPAACTNILSRLYCATESGAVGPSRLTNPASISWEKRPIKHAGRPAEIVLTEVRERLAALLGID